VLNSQFAPNATGTFGNAGYNSLRGPGYFDIDLALSREFGLREHLILHVRGEAFHLLNHPNFGLPVANISSANFGQIATAMRAAGQQKPRRQDREMDPRILRGSMKPTF
jgi:hypothetical protein